jgi:WXG100 family type VII secretion target
VVELALERRAAARAQVDVLRIADELRAERDRVSGRVGTLVASGWAGVAADQYAAGWDDWHEGAQALMSALGALGDLMGEVRAAIETTDQGAADASRLLAARLGDVP